MRSTAVSLAGSPVQLDISAVCPVGCEMAWRVETATTKNASNAVYAQNILHIDTMSTPDPLDKFGNDATQKSVQFGFDPNGKGWYRINVTSITGGTVHINTLTLTDLT